MKKSLLIIIMSFLTVIGSYSYAGDTIRVACIGNSITAWLYPGMVAAKINSKGYDVRNFGFAGTTGTLGVNINQSYLSWVNTSLYAQTKAFKPDILTISFGTNDSRTEIWNSTTYSGKFAAGIQSLIDTFKVINPNVKIYLMYPCPQIPNGRWNHQAYYIPEKVMPEVKKVADANGLKTINFYAALAGHEEYFKTGDLIHPTEVGQGILANVVTNAILGKDSLLYGEVEFLIKQTTEFCKNAVNGTAVGQYDQTKYDALQAMLTEAKNTYKTLTRQTALDSLSARFYPVMIAYQRSMTYVPELANGNYKIRLAGYCLSATKAVGSYASYDQESNDSTQIWTLTKNTTTGGYVFYNAYKKVYLSDFGVLNSSINTNLASQLIKGNGKKYSIQQNPAGASGTAFWTANARTATVFGSMGYPDFFAFDIIPTSQTLPAYVAETPLSTPIRVACVGNSITDGIDKYPTILATMLGRNYNVGNFGKYGRTINRTLANAYTKTTEYQNALAFLPNIVTIKLGTNDSNTSFWVSSTVIENDLKQLVTDFQNLSSHPTVYLCIPPKTIANTLTIRESVLRDSIAPVIRKVAADMNLKVIDTYTHLLNYPLFNVADGVHPNAEGSQGLAEAIYKGIKSEDYDYKKAPAYFTPSGEVYYNIVNKATGKSLDVSGTNAVLNTGNTDSKSQLFAIQAQTYGRYQLTNYGNSASLYLSGDSAKYNVPTTVTADYLHWFIPTATAGEYLFGTKYGALYKAGTNGVAVVAKASDVTYNDSAVWIISKTSVMPRIELPGTFYASQLAGKINTADNRMTVSGTTLGNIIAGNKCYYNVKVTKSMALDALMNASTNNITAVVTLTLVNDSDATKTYASTQTLNVTSSWTVWADNTFRFPVLPAGNYKLYVYINSSSSSWACNISGFNFLPKPPALPGTIYAGNFDSKSNAAFTKVESDQSLTGAIQGGQTYYYVEPTLVGGYTATVEYANAADASAKLNLQFVPDLSNTTEDTNYSKLLPVTGGSSTVKNWATTSYNFVVATTGRQILRLKFPNTGGTDGAYVKGITFVKKSGLAQTITFGALGEKYLGTADFEPGATASSGLQVIYSSSNTAVATIVNNKIHLVGTGSAVITATQGGNESYDAAISVTQTMAVIHTPVNLPGTVYAGLFDYNSNGAFSTDVNDNSLNTAKQGAQVCFNVNVVEAGDYTASVEYANYQTATEKINLEFVSAYTVTTENAAYTQIVPQTYSALSLPKVWAVTTTLYQYTGLTTGRKILRLRFPSAGTNWGPFVRNIVFAKKIVSGLNDIENKSTVSVKSFDGRLIVNASEIVYKVKVLNLSGSLVVDKLVNSTAFECSLPKGIYIVQIQTGSETGIRKVIVN